MKLPGAEQDLGHRRNGHRDPGARRRDRGLAPVQEADHQHRGRLLPADPCAVSGRQGPDHGRPGRHHRLDRARRRQDEGDVHLRLEVQGARQRHGERAQPEPGGVAHHPAGAALHRRTGAGGRRRHPDRPHPGAGRVRRAARLDQPDPHRPRPDTATAQGPVRRRHRVVRRRSGGQGQGDQHHAQQPVRGAHHPEPGPRRLLRRGEEPGAVRQRALQERPAVRGAEQRPRAVHQLLHQHRPGSGDGAQGSRPAAEDDAGLPRTRTPRC